MGGLAVVFKTFHRGYCLIGHVMSLRDQLYKLQIHRRLFIFSHNSLSEDWLMIDVRCVSD